MLYPLLGMLVNFIDILLDNSGILKSGLLSYVNVPNEVIHSRDKEEIKSAYFCKMSGINLK